MGGERADDEAIDARSGESGQGSVEWVGLVLLIAALFGALSFTLPAVPGTALVHSLSRSLLCAVSLSDGCLSEGSLEGEYGSEVAGLVRENTPELRFGPDLLGLPVDFRSCRSPACADSAGTGVVTRSTAGEPVTLFTRVVDCRGQPAPDLQNQADCEGATAGQLYIQYWAYYPESASLRGIPVLEDEGYHAHDWESVQVRIGPDGEVSQRASSHAGYNHGRSVANWGSDMGWGLLRDAAEAAGLRKPGGWGSSTGRLLVAGGSHAGNVDDAAADYPTLTPADSVRLIPLEQARGGPLARPAGFDPITPPWRKEVWRQAEAEGTG